VNPLASKISDSEAEIMKVLWEAGCELPMAEIRKVLGHKKLEGSKRGCI